MTEMFRLSWERRKPCQTMKIPAEPGSRAECGVRKEETLSDHEDSCRTRLQGRVRCQKGGNPVRPWRFLQNQAPGQSAVSERRKPCQTMKIPAESGSRAERGVRKEETLSDREDSCRIRLQGTARCQKGGNPVRPWRFLQNQAPGQSAVTTTCAWTHVEVRTVTCLRKERLSSLVTWNLSYWTQHLEETQIYCTEELVKAEPQSSFQQDGLLILVVGCLIDLWRWSQSWQQHFCRCLAHVNGILNNKEVCVPLRPMSKGDSFCCRLYKLGNW